MPIWLRKFYYKKIETALKAQQKQAEKQRKSTKPPKFAKPTKRIANTRR